MGTFQLDRVLDFLTSVELVIGLLWAGLALFTVTLLVLMRTRWGQDRPLGKCVVLSLLVHMLMAGFATTVQIVSAESPGEEPAIEVTFVEGPLRKSPADDVPVPERKPWEELPHDEVVQPDLPDPQPEAPVPLPDPERRIRSEPANLPSDPALDHLALAEPKQPEPKPSTTTGSMGRTSPGKAAEEIEAPAAQRRDPGRMSLPDPGAPDRRAPPAETLRPPMRTSTNDIPKALLEQLVPLPQLAAQTTPTKLPDSLIALTDRLSHPMRLEQTPSAARDVFRLPAETIEPAMAEKGSAGAELRQPWRSATAGAKSPGQQASQVPPDETAVAIMPRRQIDDPRAGDPKIPDAYRLRVAPDRSRLAERQGATPETEAAVKAALKWLAGSQSPDGRWDADDHGAGRERAVAGRDRQGAGIQADTGMTGLALLAFLASGHTHREGPYRENVRLGLQYLMRAQATDGNLGGQAKSFARMYCHAMATIAVSEAYGMTRDERLRSTVQRAVNYTLTAQNQSTGGYRYKPRDPGDTSQCGWQVMALKSAELAGIPMPTKTRNGLIRYLRTVSSGDYGGLASYRPNEQASRPMTAEALVCWQFLGMPREHPAGNEAGDYLLGELPGQGQPNLYYWYYATLGMYQLQGVHWQRWNDALKSNLVDSQRRSGDLAGTWDPNTVWGGYGGRVYSTALATLCLEVYYRFLPLYANTAPAKDRAK